MSWLELSPADRRRGGIATRNTAASARKMLRSPLVVLLCGLVGASQVEYVPQPKVKAVPGTPDCVSDKVAGGGHCPNFKAGAICDGVDIDDPAADMLSGKHLIIQDMDWSPYATPTGTHPIGWEGPAKHPTGWSGLNIELFDIFADKLNFTYTMSDMGYAGTHKDANGELIPESWTEMVMRAIDDADLTGSYWTETNKRLNGVTYIRGTYDLTPVLVARMLSAGETKAETWYKSFYNYLDPFTYGLWASILAVIICSGVVDWLVERKSVKEARVTASIYEYFAGLCAASLEHPPIDASVTESHVCAQVVGWLRVSALEDECRLSGDRRFYRARPHLVLHCQPCRLHHRLGAANQEHPVDGPSHPRQRFGACSRSQSHENLSGLNGATPAHSLPCVR